MTPRLGPAFRHLVTSLATCLLASANGSAAADPAAPLTNTAQIRALSGDELARRPAVRLRGVVTYHEPETGLTYVQDATAGVALACGVPSRLPRNLAAGSHIEVSGIAVDGPFAPVVAGAGDAQPQVSILGKAPWPEPLTVTVEQLFQGAHDGRWIELRGSVRSLAVKEFDPAEDGDRGLSSGSRMPNAMRISIELGTLAGRFTVIIPWLTNRPPPAGWLDARVRVRGVLGSIVNSRRQWVGLLLYVPSIDQIAVERPPAADPFALPVSRLAELMRRPSHTDGDERMRVRGEVTLVQPGFRIFLRCEEGATLQVQTRSNKGLAPGMVVDVVGYPTLIEKRVVLQDAVCRTTGTNLPPAPRRVSVEQIMRNDVDGELIRLEGRLLQNTQRGAEHLLLIESGEQLVEGTLAATLNPAESRWLRAVNPGSVVALTGVSQIRGPMLWSGTVKRSSLQLLLRSPADIEVRQRPPWWTVPRLLGLSGVLAGLIALGLIWVSSLRRQVRAQTETIRRRIRREAVWEERSRIARDIHDDVGAALTQISLLGELGRRDGAGVADMRRQLARVTEKSREAVRSLDEIVWTVNPRNDPVARAASYLCQTVQDLVRDTPMRCRLTVPEELPPQTLGARARHHLFLAVKEAVNNVIKHSGATELRLAIEAPPGYCIVRIEDDGQGFDPGGTDPSRSGLGNMRRRIEEVGGVFALTTSPGNGTVVTFTIPAEAATT